MQACKNSVAKESRMLHLAKMLQGLAKLQAFTVRLMLSSSAAFQVCHGGMTEARWGEMGG
jgi:hypothetical protein